MLQWNMRVMDRLKLKMFFGIWNLRHIIHPAIALMAKWSVIIATWNILVIGHGRLLQMFLPKNRCKTEVLWVHWCFVDGSQPKMAIFWARWMTCSDANRGSFRCGAKFIELLMLDTSTILNHPKPMSHFSGCVSTMVHKETERTPRLSLHRFVLSLPCRGSTLLEDDLPHSAGNSWQMRTMSGNGQWVTFPSSSRFLYLFPKKTLYKTQR